MSLLYLAALRSPGKHLPESNLVVCEVRGRLLGQAHARPCAHMRTCSQARGRSERASHKGAVEMWSLEVARWVVRDGDLPIGEVQRGLWRVTEEEGVRD